MEALHNSPSHSEFIPLSEHQSQTPASFYDGPAILYHQSSSCTLKISKHDLDATTAFASLAAGGQSTDTAQVNGHSNGALQNGEKNNANDEDEHERSEDIEVEIPNTDIWVTSERFILFSPSQTAGVSIPYPSISLHAVQRSSPPTATPASLFLQILPEASATFDDHDPDETISLYLIPAVPAPPPSSTTSTSSTDPASSAAATAAAADEVGSIFAALSACANLHPDVPMHGDDEEGDEEEGGGEGGVGAGYGGDGVMSGLPPPMPGSGGWITAENVGDFVDEEGNWRERSGGGAERLGQGAGRVRGRDEDDGEEGEREGDGDETKWSRTG